MHIVLTMPRLEQKSSLMILLCDSRTLHIKELALIIRMEWPNEQSRLLLAGHGQCCYMPSSIGQIKQTCHCGRLLLNTPCTCGTTCQIMNLSLHPLSYLPLVSLIHTIICIMLMFGDAQFMSLIPSYKMERSYLSEVHAVNLVDTLARRWIIRLLLDTFLTFKLAQSLLNFIASMMICTLLY